MSVKFQETVKTKVTEGAQKATEKNEDFSHRIGEYLTGGETGKGYLAVHTPYPAYPLPLSTNTCMAGLPQTTPDKPPPHQNAHVRCPGWYPRSPGLLARS